MEQKKEQTKHLIAQSFKNLMYRHPFDKITIKMISDEAGIIRSTFYNHFRDKYDLIEWIFYTEIIYEAQSLLNLDMRMEAIKFFFRCIVSDRIFYQKAFLITGQNNFESILMKYLTELFLDAMKRHKGSPLPQNNRALTPELISSCYAMSIVTNLKKLILDTPLEKYTEEEMLDAFIFLTAHSMSDLIG